SDEAATAARARAYSRKRLARLSWTPDGARCKHSDRLIVEETQHGPIHGRLLVRQRSNCGVGTPIPGRPLSLSRLPQASWGPFSRFRGVPSGCGDDRWRNTRLRRAVFLSPLRLVHFRTQRRRNRSEPRIPGCPSPTDANQRKLDRPSRVLVGAVSAHETIRARPCRPGSLWGVGRTNGAKALS